MLFELKDAQSVAIVKKHLADARRKGHRIGLTSGSFDIIHFHHAHFFMRCRRLCDHLLVGIDSDELVREHKGETRPLIYDYRRAVMVDGLKTVAFTFIINSVEDFGLAAKVLRPDVIFKSTEFLGREHEIVGREYASEVKIIRDVIDLASTTEILSAIQRNGDQKKTKRKQLAGRQKPI